MQGLYAMFMGYGMIKNMKNISTVIPLLGANLEISPLDSGSYFFISQATDDGIITLHIDDIVTVIKALETVIAVEKAKQCAA